MISDIIKYSTSNLRKRKLRSFLSVLSILIGVTAIFALISFGQGIKLYIEELSKEQGTDKLMMMPKGYMGPGKTSTVFTDNDIDFIRKIKGVDEATGAMIKTVKVKFKDYKEKYVYAMGMKTEGSEKKLAEELLSLDIEEGRAIKNGDIFKATLGHNYRVPNKLFKKPISVGDTIQINDIDVKVVGFYEEVGNPSDDSQIYLSYEGAKEILGIDYYEYLFIKSAPGQNPTELSDKIKEKFRKYKGQKEGEEDFFVQTFEEAIATFTSIITIINGILFLIAFISIIVAAVNIMNTMYTSVLERTSEIGVMKAIGAQNKFILYVFMTESGLLGLIGGTFGVIFGYGIAKFGEYIAKAYGLSMLRPAFPLWLILSCLLFSFLVGAGSGFFPSLRAAKLKPVEALRYE